MASDIAQPSSFLYKPLKTQWQDFFGGCTSLAINVWNGNLPSAVSNVAGLLKAIHFDKDKPGEVAWGWIARSLARAIAKLIQEQPEILRKQCPTDVESIAETMAMMMEGKEVCLDRQVFLRPKEAAFLKDFQDPFSNWLQKFGLDAAPADTIASRLPGYFVEALDNEWRERPDDYKLVKDALSGPAASAAQEEIAWRSYFARLQKEIHEPVLDEPFGLDQIYIWPRGYYEEKSSPDLEKPDYEDFRRAEVKRTAFWLKDALLDWLNCCDGGDDLKVISGGPGSGKSVFTKMLSAQLAEQGRRVLRIPLHHLDLQKTWDAAISDWARKTLSVEFNPLSPPMDDYPCLVIFDGVDELVQEGKIAEELVSTFLDHVKRDLHITNEPKLRVRVIVSGREYAIQSHKSDLRDERQILHLLPYWIDDRLKDSFSEHTPLLELDQRDEWWVKYGKCKGLEYPECPEKLKVGVFGDLITQPLLNHLVARLYQEGSIDSAESNPNVIYQKIVESVYNREEWSEVQFRPITQITEEDFNRTLQEIAVCTWHGGRCTTVNAIETQCQDRQLTTVLDALRSRTHNPISLLLTAFFFREGAQNSTGDRTVEFTHKTFQEYLTSRRIVKQIANSSRDLRRRLEDCYDGCDANAALIHWAELCGPAPMDRVLVKFLRNEVKRQPVATVRQWQQDLKKLIDHMLKHGMPMDSLQKLKYAQKVQNARNAEETLLACIGACAATSGERYKLTWPEKTSAGEWINRLRGQRKEDRVLEVFSYPFFFSHRDLSQLSSFFAPFPLTVLSNGDFSHQTLVGQDLIGADLRGADLSGADLKGAILLGVNLSDAVLRNTDLRSALLSGADLRGADLSGAILRGADLSLADISTANLTGAQGFQVRLVSACLEGADLSGAELIEADLSGSYCDNANLTDAKLFGAHLKRSNLSKAVLSCAKLEGAILSDANLSDANLTRANLQSADLNGARLSKANLQSANLKNTDLTDADLSDSNLKDAKLLYAFMRRANLAGAILEGANLLGAVLPESFKKS